MKRKTSGFTIVELAIVIVIIAILATITIFTYTKVQVSARDSDRSSKITAISSALERYYEQNGEYPSCTTMKGSGSSVGTTLGGLDPAALITPTSAAGTGNSITQCTDLSGNEGDVFAYVGDGSTACSTGSACADYTLEYREESTGNIISVKGRHQAAATPVNAPGAPVVTAKMESDGATATGTAGAVTCETGTPQYRFHYRYTATATMGSWSDWTSWSSTVMSQSVAGTSQGFQYGFQAEAQCYDGNNTSAASADSNIATATRSISTPAAPKYLTPSQFYSNVNAVVNYQAYCPAGTTPTNTTFRSVAWTGGTWTNPWGFNDSWENYNSTDQYVNYYGKYQCKTNYTTSAYSPESYNRIVVHHQ